MKICRSGRRAFTLLELIVVIVVLGVLAAIAIPTFAGVVDRSDDEATRSTLAAVVRDAEAIRALDPSETWASALGVALSETSAVSGPGLSAAEAWSLAGAADAPSTSHRSVSFSTAGTFVEVATLSPSGRAVFASTVRGRSTAASCFGSADGSVTASASSPSCEATAAPSTTTTVAPVYLGRTQPMATVADNGFPEPGFGGRSGTTVEVSDLAPYLGYASDDPAVLDAEMTLMEYAQASAYALSATDNGDGEKQASADALWAAMEPGYNTVTIILRNYAS